MPHPKVKIADNSGNEVGVTSNRLNVNAYLTATPTIDIGDVSLLLGGTAASVNNGAADATTLRVTIASDTTGVLSVDDNGGSLTVDGTFWQTTQPISGTITANLSSTDNAVLDTIDAVLDNILTKNTEIDAVLDTIKSDTQSIETAVELLDNAISGSEMQVDIVSSATLTVDGSGVTQPISGTITANLSATDNAVLDAMVVDLAAIEVQLGTLGTIKVDTEAIETAVELIDDAIYADDGDFTINSDKGMLVMGLQSVGHNITAGDVGAITVDEKGQVRTVTNMGELDTFAMIDVDNAVETLSSNTGTITDCIEMILQADESNSGYIMIGDGDVGDNRGVKLNAGDTFILTTNDTRTVSLWGSAADQNLRCMLMRSDI